MRGPQASCLTASRRRFDRERSNCCFFGALQRSGRFGDVKSLRGGVGLAVLNYLAGKCRTFRIDCNGGDRGPAKRATVRVGETRTSQAGSWKQMVHESAMTASGLGKKRENLKHRSLISECGGLSAKNQPYQGELPSCPGKQWSRSTACLKGIRNEATKFTIQTVLGLDQKHQSYSQK